MEEYIKAGYITRKQLETAREYQRSNGCKIGVALLTLGFITCDQVQDYAEHVIEKLI